jgi:hypothetical protein
LAIRGLQLVIFGLKKICFTGGGLDIGYWKFGDWMLAGGVDGRGLRFGS